MPVQLSMDIKHHRKVPASYHPGNDVTFTQKAKGYLSISLAVILIRNLSARVWVCTRDSAFRDFWELESQAVVSVPHMC